MDAYQDSDPLDTGRRMVLRWGKNVKRTVKFGTGGVPTNLRKKEKVVADSGGDRRGGGDNDEAGIPDQRQDGNDLSYLKDPVSVPRSDDNDFSTSTDKQSSLPSKEASLSPLCKAPPKSTQPTGPVYDPALHSAEAIIVVSPTDSRLLKFITTVASFVAKDGSVLEHKLIERESSNPDFRFLLPRAESGSNLASSTTAFLVSESESDAEERLAEHIFYRWRVYSFAQGDGINSWRTDPFIMYEPHGRFWVPPPLDADEARREEEAQERREQVIVSAQEERRKLADKKDFMTGRQLEHAKFGSLGLTNVEKGGGTKLNDWEKEKFDELLRKKLCASQESICEAMAFAFDKSGAAREISDLLKEAVLESGNGISVDTRIARLFLVSDILFNSQQPGVRNAFQYRDAIESMSPQVFESLGKHGNGTAGRMTMNKLRKAVSSVLSAWTNWSVYNSTFLDELHCRFEGKEITSAKLEHDNNENKEEILADGDRERHVSDEPGENEDSGVVSNTPRGEWTTSEHIHDSVEDVDGEALDDVDGELDDVDGEALDDIDGEMICDDVDGEVLADDE